MHSCAYKKTDNLTEHIPLCCNPVEAYAFQKENVNCVLPDDLTFFFIYRKVDILVAGGMPYCVSDSWESGIICCKV
jgi:hypothetical protein